MRLSSEQRDRIHTSAGRAAVAELGWRRLGGVVDAAAVTPLTDSGQPLLALPFARINLARALASAGRATLVLSDVRLALKGWEALTVPVAVRIEADRDGDYLPTGPIEELLRKRPADRDLIGNRILMRDHWWYVPRILVWLDPLCPPEMLPRRSGPNDGVLFTGDGRAPPRGAVARVTDWDDPAPGLCTGAGQAPPDASAACLLRHDFSMPDRAVACEYRVHGRLRGGRMEVSGRYGERRLPRSPGTVARLLAQWRLGKACRRALTEPIDGTGNGNRP